MIGNVTAGEVISNYHYNGKVYHIEVFYDESGFVNAFASFQVDEELETDEEPGVGEHEFDREKAVERAIWDLGIRYNHGA